MFANFKLKLNNALVAKYKTSSVKVHLELAAGVALSLNLLPASLSPPSPTWRQLVIGLSALLLALLLIGPLLNAASDGLVLLGQLPGWFLLTLPLTGYSEYLRRKGRKYLLIASAIPGGFLAPAA